MMKWFIILFVASCFTSCVKKKIENKYKQFSCIEMEKFAEYLFTKFHYLIVDVKCVECPRHLSNTIDSIYLSFGVIPVISKWYVGTDAYWSKKFYYNPCFKKYMDYKFLEKFESREKAELKIREILTEMKFIPKY